MSDFGDYDKEVTRKIVEIAENTIDTYQYKEGYLNNGTYREQVTGDRNFSAATMERAISESLRAGTISSTQASALREAASKKPQR